MKATIKYPVGTLVLVNDTRVGFRGKERMGEIVHICPDVFMQGERRTKYKIKFNEWWIDEGDIKPLKPVKTFKLPVEHL